METSLNMAATALEQFMAYEFKNCLTELSKIKSKNPQEKDIFRLLNNFAVTEYVSEKNRKVQDFLNKIEDIIQENKPKAVPTSNTKQSKGSRKVSGPTEEEISDKNSNDAEDDMILKYNHAVALYHAGKKLRSLEAVNALFLNQEVVFDYVVIKISCLCLELALMAKDFSKVQKILEFFDKNTTSASLDISNEGEEPQKSENEKEGPPKKFSESNSLILPAEVYKQGDRPRVNSRMEFGIITLIYKIQVCIYNGNFDIAARKMSELETQFNEFISYLKSLSTLKSTGSDKQKSANDSKYNEMISERLQGYMHMMFKHLKACLAYHYNDTKKCIQILATPSSFDKFDNPKMFSSPYELFLQYNNLGCVHFKENKYNLACFYLTKAVNVLQKQLKPESMSNMSNVEECSKNKYESALFLTYSSKAHYVLYNLGTALFKSKKYNETIEIFSSISDKMVDHPKFWYNFGLTYLSKYHKLLNENFQQRKSNLYETVLDQHNSTLEEDKIVDTSKLKRTEEPPPETKDAYHYTRFVMNSKDLNATPLEEEIGAPSTISNKHALKYEQYYKIHEASGAQVGPTALRACLEKARNCFRSCLVIINKMKGQTKDDKSGNFFNMKTSEYAYKEGEKDATEKDEKYRSDEHVPIQTLQARHQEILQSVHVHLAYTSLCLGEINSAINYARDAISLPNQSEENKYLCLMYLVEAYCHLGNAKEALHKINQMNIGQTIMTAARNVLGINQAYFADSIPNKTVIFTNLTTIHLLNNNINGAQDALKNAFPVDKNPLPPLPLLNLKIYFHLRNGQPYQALQLLKRKRILNTSTSSNKILLKIAK